MIVKITPAGMVQFIWNDALLPVFNQGVGRITRASHVEPTDEGKWVADLSPRGPLLGPFEKRCDALDAEVQWIEENILGV